MRPSKTRKWIENINKRRKWWVMGLALGYKDNIKGVQRVETLWGLGFDSTYDNQRTRHGKFGLERSLEGKETTVVGPTMVECTRGLQRANISGRRTRFPWSASGQAAATILVVRLTTFEVSSLGCTLGKHSFNLFCYSWVMALALKRRWPLTQSVHNPWQTNFPKNSLREISCLPEL